MLHIYTYSHSPARVPLSDDAILDWSDIHDFAVK